MKRFFLLTFLLFWIVLSNAQVKKVIYVEKDGQKAYAEIRIYRESESEIKEGYISSKDSVKITLFSDWADMGQYYFEEQAEIKVFCDMCATESFVIETSENHLGFRLNSLANKDYPSGYKVIVRFPKKIYNGDGRKFKLSENERSIWFKTTGI